MSNIVIINRGSRTYTLRPITKIEEVELADGTKQKRQVVLKERTLPPGGSIETIDDAEAQFYLAYRDIADAANVVPANADRIKNMQSEIDRLTAVNKDLMSRSTETETQAEAVPSRKKGK
jgi:hypothetical protein